MIPFSIIAFVIIVFALIVCKLLSMLLTHLFFRDQFEWFRDRQVRLKRSPHYIVFLLKYLSILSLPTLMHAYQLPDAIFRFVKLAALSTFFFLFVVSLFLMISGSH